MKIKRIIPVFIIMCIAFCTLITAGAVFAAQEVDTLFYEQFDYTKGQSISQSAAAANGWSVHNESSISSGKGSTSLVKADPDNSGNSVLDIETFTSTANLNRNVCVSGAYNANGKRYLMINKKVKITTSSSMKGKYAFYVYGKYADASTGEITTTNQTLMLLEYDMQNNLFKQEISTQSSYVDVASIPSAITDGEWVNVKIVIDCTLQTYNLYVNEVQVNDAPVSLRSKRNGEVVAGISSLQLCPNRWLGLSSHFYMDDIKISATNDSSIRFFEGFEYPALKDNSISKADAWKFETENNDTSTTGSTAYIKAAPDNASNLVFDTQVYRSYSTNQYPTLSCGASIMGDAVLQADFRFGDSAKNTYIWYVWGYVKTSSGKYGKQLLEFYFKRGENKITCSANGTDTTISTTELPTNQWFNIKVVIHTTDNNFDIYKDNTKLNSSPILFKEVTEGGTVTGIGVMQLGVSRWSGSPGHMYVDNITVKSSAAEVLATEANQLSLPSTLVYDYKLPTAGVYEGTTISWTSSNESVLSSSGKVNRNVGFGNTVVTLTATIAAGGETRNKAIDVKVVNAPYYTIDSLVFETAGGDVSYSAVAGGKVKSIFVTKYTNATDDNAAAYVVIYDANGKLIAASTPVNITATGELAVNMQLPNQEGMYAKAYVWNSKTLKPLAYSYSTKLKSGATVYTIGDSTMQSYGTIEARRSDNGMTGWAQVLPLAIKNNSVTVENDAVAGTSTLSFYNLGYIHPIYDSIKPGDYLIIQFGHNDEKPWMSEDAGKNYSPLEPIHQEHPKALEVPEWATSRKTYEQWLREYAAAARMKGAQVVFATSIYRHFFESDGTLAYSHYGYPEAMVDTAAETGAPLLDLCSRTGEWLTALGAANNSLKYFMAYHGGTDHTHLTYDGAVEVSNMALNELRRIGHPLKDAFTSVPAR